MDILPVLFKALSLQFCKSTIWVSVYYNLSFSVLSQILVLEFYNNLSCWVWLLFEFLSLVAIWVFEFSCYLSCHNLSFDFITIWVFAYCHNSSFEFCHNLSFCFLSQFQFLHFVTRDSVLCLSRNGDGLLTYSSVFFFNFFSPINMILVYINLSKKNICEISA